jgi:hypothetical protein
MKHLYARSWDREPPSDCCSGSAATECISGHAVVCTTGEERKGATPGIAIVQHVTGSQDWVNRLAIARRPWRVR